MTFRALFEFVSALDEVPIVLESRILPKVIELTGQDNIWFVAADLETALSYGHIRQHSPIPKPYQLADDAVVWTSEIRFHRDLSVCWQRFVCCKELMHLFDTPAQRADTAAKLKHLLIELETPAPWDQASEMYKSEINTQWMALAVLCPPKLRALYEVRWRAGAMSDYEVALELRIPEAVVKGLMSPHYDLFVAELTA